MRPGMNLDSNSGLLIWIPTKSDIGQHYLNLYVKDGHHASGTNQELQIFVYDTPIFTGELPTESFVGLEYTSFITGKDMFGKKIRDESIGTEMTSIRDYTLSEYGRYFKWTPTNLDIGIHKIHVRITDKYGFTTLYTHNISVFNNPCFQCDSSSEDSPPDTTGN